MLLAQPGVSGATKTFSVRVRDTFQTPSTLRNPLFKRLERSSEEPSLKIQGWQCTHWPFASSPWTRICSEVR